MQKTLAISAQHPYRIYLLAAICSICISFWITANQAVVNPDAICYLMSAEAMSQMGFSNAMHLCGQAAWPFYPLMLHFLNSITHLSVVTSAYVIDGLFSLISVLTFILIIKEIGGRGRVLYYAAGVILLSHVFNSVREYIIRDHGFWAFYLSSIFLLLRYYQNQKPLYAILSSGSLMIATLFRIEGFLLLISIPFVTWFLFEFSLAKRLKFFLTLNLPTILLGLMMGSWLYWHPEQLQHKWSRIDELIVQFTYGYLLIANQFVHIKAVLLQYVLSDLSEHDVNLVICCLLIIWYLINLITILSPINAALVLYAWFNKKVTIESRAKIVLAAYILINLFVTFVFFSEALFVAKRYLVGLTLVLMLWIPFALDVLFSQSLARKKYWVIGAVAICLLYSAVGGLFEFGPSKEYLREAGDWLAISIPADQKLYSNDIQVMYYSKHYGNTIFQAEKIYRNTHAVADEKWKNYNYIALRLAKNESEQKYFKHQLIPIKIFKNNRGDRVVIYKV